MLVGLMSMAAPTARASQGAAVAEGSSAARVARSAFSFDAKIARNMRSRGWTTESIDEVIAHPARTRATRDVRNIGNGMRHSDPNGITNFPPP